jgi:hypothetical protein
MSNCGVTARARPLREGPDFDAPMTRLARANEVIE